jgi:solute carrier family 6 GABA transporter-like protein 1
MNRAIVTGKNWRLHWSWPVMLKYITAPAVGLVFTFAYPKFIENNWDKDPPYLYSFILFHIVMIFIVGLFIFPKFFNMLVPAHRRDEGKYDVQPQYTIGETPVIVSGGIEAGERAVSDSPRTSTEVTTENKRV